MPVAVTFEDRDAWRGPLASFALHLFAGAALLFVPLTQQRFFQPAEPVPVEIITAQQFEAAAEPEPRRAQKPLSVAPPVEQPRKEASIPRTSPQKPAEPEIAPMIRPQRMLSEGALADPRSRKAKAQLRMLAADERIVQLCNIEAMEQVRAWNTAFRPETVIPYSLQGLKMAGGSIIADGAAIYSARDWYRLRFECGVQADKVVSFAFSVGDPVPRSDWEANNLTEPADDDDD